MSAFERLGRAHPDRRVRQRRDRPLSCAGCSRQPGRTNDFRRSTASCSWSRPTSTPGVSVAFGAPGLDHVPISTRGAGERGAARPVPAGRDRRSLLRRRRAAARRCTPRSRSTQGVDLLLCLNPLVPFDTPRRRTRDRERRSAAGRGRPAGRCWRRRSARSSTRAWRSGMERYKTRVPGTDIVLFEPNRARRRHVLHQHLQLLEPPPAVRARLPEDARGAVRAAPRAGAAARAPRHRHPHRRAARRSADSGEEPARSRGIWRETASTAATRLLTHTLDDLERWLRDAASPPGPARAGPLLFLRPPPPAPPSPMERKPPRRTRERILELPAAVQRLRRAERQHDADRRGDEHLPRATCTTTSRTRTTSSTASSQQFEREIDKLLALPTERAPNVEDAWLFLHVLFELIWKYRFLYRDLNNLLSQQPHARDHTSSSCSTQKVQVARALCEGLVAGRRAAGGRARDRGARDQHGRRGDLLAVVLRTCAIRAASTQPKSSALLAARLLPGDGAGGAVPHRTVARAVRAARRRHT